jgi:RNA polymerase sigma-70 factor, ECF subfamily
MTAAARTGPRHALLDVGAFNENGNPERIPIGPRDGLPWARPRPVPVDNGRASRPRGRAAPFAGAADGSHTPPALSPIFAGAVAQPPVTSPDRARDRELLGRVARGDVRALRTVYEEHASRAMAIAMRVLRDTHEAEDIVQETFLELWRRAPQYDCARGGAVAWVVTIARSRAIDRLRAAGTAARTLEGAGDVVAPASVPSPTDHAERRSDQARIADALAALPTEQRQTIELAYFAGLSQSEIAARTGSPLGTVKMRVKLAMGKLATMLREAQGDA